MGGGHRRRCCVDRVSRSRQEAEADRHDPGGECQDRAAVEHRGPIAKPLVEDRRHASREDRRHPFRRVEILFVRVFVYRDDLLGGGVGYVFFILAPGLVS